MKKILMAITLLISMASCEYDYPEEVTYTGEGIHGFKLDGKKWVTYITGFSPCCIEYDSINSVLQFNLSTKQEKVKKQPCGSIYLFMLIDKKYFRSDIKFPLSGGDEIYSNFRNEINIDSLVPYIDFSLQKEQSKHTRYSKVISGELQFRRLDSIAVGTFEARLSNGIDTIAITDGKFDYKIIMD